MATPKRDRRPDGVLYAVAGFSRSGKTEWVTRQVRDRPRLLLWDFKGEWRRYRCRRVESFVELAQLVKPGAKPERIAFHLTCNMAAAFDTFCRFAYIWIRAARGVLVVEETASVTSPGKAPAAWGDIIRMGLGFGADIYAITQRPAESDKTALGNASVIHCGIMGTPDDRRTMARYLDVPLPLVEALRPLQWIERDRRTGALSSGAVSFGKLRR